MLKQRLHVLENDHPYIVVILSVLSCICEYVYKNTNSRISKTTTLSLYTLPEVTTRTSRRRNRGALRKSGSRRAAQSIPVVAVAHSERHIRTNDERKS